MLVPENGGEGKRRGMKGQRKYRAGQDLYAEVRRLDEAEVRRRNEAVEEGADSAGRPGCMTHLHGLGLLPEREEGLQASPLGGCP